MSLKRERPETDNFVIKKHLGGNDKYLSEKTPQIKLFNPNFNHKIRVIYIP